MTDSLLSALDLNTRQVLDALAPLDTDAINRKPNSGVWSLAQVVDHLTRSDAVMARVARGTTEPSQRDPLEKVAQMRTRFGDFESKLSAFGMLIPGNEAMEMDELIRKFTDSRAQFRDAVATGDPTDLCTRFAHPLFGQLTRAEWGWFTIIHTERHLVQFARIQAMLSGS
jgi:uncharacterized damage-inducible protein DinB